MKRKAVNTKVEAIKSSGNKASKTKQKVGIDLDDAKKGVITGNTIYSATEFARKERQ